MKYTENELSSVVLRKTAQSLLGVYFISFFGTIGRVEERGLFFFLGKLVPSKATSIYFMIMRLHGVFWWEFEIINPVSSWN